MGLGWLVGWLVYGWGFVWGHHTNIEPHTMNVLIIRTLNKDSGPPHFRGQGRDVGLMFVDVGISDCRLAEA